MGRRSRRPAPCSRSACAPSRVEGEANAALTAFLAKALGVAKRDVTLARGGQSRLKMIEVAGLSEAEVRDRLSGN